MIKIIGLGNPLMGDDAFGLFVIDELKNRLLNGSNEDIKLISLPTPSPWDIYEVLREGGDFIIIDVFDKGSDGKIEVFPISDLSKVDNKFKTVHDININQVIDLLSLHNITVKGFIIGTKGYNFNISLELSEYLDKLVKSCSDRVLELVLSYKKNH